MSWKKKEDVAIAHISKKLQRVGPEEEEIDGWIF
jgi:hypothetical protein